MVSPSGSLLMMHSTRKAEEEDLSRYNISVKVETGQINIGERSKFVSMVDSDSCVRDLSGESASDAWQSENGEADRRHYVAWRREGSRDPWGASQPPPS